MIYGMKWELWNFSIHSWNYLPLRDIKMVDLVEPIGCGFISLCAPLIQSKIYTNIVLHVLDLLILLLPILAHMLLDHFLMQSIMPKLWSHCANMTCWLCREFLRVFFMHLVVLSNHQNTKQDIWRRRYVLYLPRSIMLRAFFLQPFVILSKLVCSQHEWSFSQILGGWKCLKYLNFEQLTSLL